MQNCVDDRVRSRQRISALFTDARLVRVTLTLILGALGSIPLVFLTPPFQVPDEVQHFYRAYQLSDFQIRAEVQNGVSGGILPASLTQLVKSTVFTRDAIYYPATPQPIAKTLKLSSIPLDPSKRRFVPFPTSAFCSALAYIPQVFGICLGRLFGCGPLYLLYLGRLFNCLVALALVALAVYRMPIAAELIIIVGILPMSLFLYASVSPDASVIDCALLFTALSFSATTRGNWSTWELVTAASAAAVFCSVKPPYVPIVLVGLVPAVFQRPKAAGVVRSHLILLAVALGAAVGWMLFAKSSMTSPLDGAHPSLQMALVLHRPGILLRALANALGGWKILGLYYETVGMFGWLTVPLRPVAAFYLPLISFAIIWYLGGRGSGERSLTRALWCMALALSAAFLAMTAMYLMASLVGQNEVTGVQGRYFIPVLVLAGMSAIELAPRGRISPSRWISTVWIAPVIILQIIATDTTIIRAFHVF